MTASRRFAFALYVVSLRGVTRVHAVQMVIIRPTGRSDFTMSCRLCSAGRKHRITLLLLLLLYLLMSTFTAPANQEALQKQSRHRFLDRVTTSITIWRPATESCGPASTSGSLINNEFPGVRHEGRVVPPHIVRPYQVWVTTHRCINTTCKLWPGWVKPKGETETQCIMLVDCTPDEG